MTKKPPTCICGHEKDGHQEGGYCMNIYYIGGQLEDCSCLKFRPAIELSRVRELLEAEDEACKKKMMNDKTISHVWLAGAMYSLANVERKLKEEEEKTR